MRDGGMPIECDAGLQAAHSTRGEVTLPILNMQKYFKYYCVIFLLFFCEHQILSILCLRQDDSIDFKNNVRNTHSRAQVMA